MSNLVLILNVAVVLGLVISAILAAELENLLSAVIALSITGLFAAASLPDFLQRHNQDHWSKCRSDCRFGNCNIRCMQDQELRSCKQAGN